MTTIPFDTPTLLNTKRISGFVNVPPKDGADSEISADQLNWGNSSALVTADIDEILRASSKQEEMNDSMSKLAGPTFLRRTSTMAGNILVMEDKDGEQRGFWLQRKIGKTTYGTIRIGFKLNPSKSIDDDGTSSNVIWELVPTPESISLDGSKRSLAPFQMVTILVMDTRVLENDTKSLESLHNPRNELSALQMIAEHAPGGHVVSSKMIGVCSQNIYAILPYHADGNLFQYRLERGPLDEAVARYWFRQILKGLETLQTVGLCHRNLSLETVYLNGVYCELTKLGWSLRVKSKSKISTGGGEGADPDLPGKRLPLPAGSNPQFVAPEVLQNVDDWDGFSADLWSCGLMLFGLVVSTEALFAAPIPEDRIFQEMCVKSNVRGHVDKWCTKVGKKVELSDELSDLLTLMLKADHKKRLTLDEVINHPWIKVDSEDEIPPGVLAHP